MATTSNISTGLDDFKSRLIGGGARPNLFSVKVDFPGNTGGDMELASFMIKAASLPASVIGQIEVPFRGRKLKVSGDRTFETWTVTVINDTGMDIRNAFERWSNAISQHGVNESSYVGTGALDYMRNITVEQLDRSNATVKTYTLVDAWPLNVGNIELNYDTTDTIEEFTVEFQYQYWTSDTTTPTSVN